MPDSFDNWTPDSAFWDDAWADMQQRLDTEQQPRRRAFAFWTWAAYGMFYGIVVILISALIYTAQTQPNTSSVAAQEIAISDDQTPIYSTELITEPSLETTASSVNPSVTSAEHPQTRTEEPAITKIIVPPAPLTISLVASESTTPVITSQPILNATDSPKPTEIVTVLQTSTDDIKDDLTTVDLSNAVTITQTALSLLNTDILPVSITDRVLPSPTPQSLKPEFKGSNTVAQFSARLYLSHGSHFPGLGYGAGLAWQRPVSNRWSLGAELLVRQEQLPLRLGNANNDEDALVDPTVGSPGRDNDIEQLSNLLESENLDYVTLSTIGLEAKAAYQLGQRWQASAGVGLHYILGGQGPRINGVQAEANRVISNFFSNDLEQIGEDILSAVSSPTGAGGGQIVESVNVNRLQLESRLGINFQLSPRWSIGADTRYRMTNVYDTSSLKLGRLRGQLSLSYRF